MNLTEAVSVATAGAYMVAPVDGTRRRSWSQFHGDAANEGSNFVATSFALRAAWSTDVGPVVHCSPVIGLDGTIYVANAKGRLTAVNPDGTKKWDATFNAPIVASPAVGENGNVYVVTTNTLNETLISTIAVVSPTGTVLRIRLLPDRSYTTASPKTWTIGDSTYVLLFARHPTLFDASALFVFDQNLELVQRADMACVLPIGTNPLFEFFKDVWNFLSEPGIEFDVSGPYTPINKRYGWLDPTVAVAELPGLATHDEPIIVTNCPPCELRAFRFAPPALQPLWQQEHKLTLCSSPAVLNQSSIMVVARLDGKVLGYDVATGTKRWSYDAEGPAMGTPASLGGLVYVVSRQHVQALDPATGEEIFKTKLPGETISSPAMSATHVFVSTASFGSDNDITSGRELTSYSFDFRRRGHDVNGGGGLSSPAIGKDGTVYAVATDGSTAFLRAYAPPES